MCNIGWTFVDGEQIIDVRDILEEENGGADMKKQFVDGEQTIDLCDILLEEDSWRYI